MLQKALKNKWAGLLLGIVLLGAGIYFLNQTEVKCGSQVMQEGDTCTRTKYGVAGSANSLDEQRDANHLKGMVSTIAGGVLLVGSAGLIVWSRLRRPEEAAAESVASAS